MTEENAALTEDALNQDDQGQIDEIEQAPEVEETDSAPVEAEEKPQEDGFQKRINKVTADKYAEKRRADELQRKLDELETKKPEAPQEAPKAEDFDYDDDAFKKAQIQYEVQQAIQEQKKVARAQATEQEALKAQSSFNERIAAYGKEDFAERASEIPILPDGVANALMHAENGPELIYHLGTHLDKADQLSGMTPQAAMMELGRISANMAVKPEIKPSAAPDPIEPINSGGALSKDDDFGATFE